MKRLHFLVIFVLLPHSLFSMHLISRSSSKTAPQGRDFFAQQAKKNLPNDGVQWVSDVEIQRHITMLEESNKLIKEDKQGLTNVGLWPEKEGRDLEDVLNKNTFCSNFKSYASKTDSELRWSSIGAFGSGLAAAGLIVGGATGLAIPVTFIASACCFYKLRGLHSNGRDLTNIARYDREKLEPAYITFKKQLEINKARKLIAEVDKKNNE
jgi:hypothetical protein